MQRIVGATLTIGLAIYANLASAEEIVIRQLARSFSMLQASAKVGDTLVFINDDPFVHNVFSLSDTQSFDLGSFRKGETRKVLLQKAGTVLVECAVHPGMQMSVNVKK